MYRKAVRCSIISVVPHSQHNSCRFCCSNNNSSFYASHNLEHEQLLQSQARLEEMALKEMSAMEKVALYPHSILTKVAKPVSAHEFHDKLLTNRIRNMCETAKDLNCISFSAPKIYWDAAIVLIKSEPGDSEFEVWVNPVIPNYYDLRSVAPMYGTWENCISCGSCCAWVLRPQTITCFGKDMYGNDKHDVLEGMRARCLMHELDHLNGRSIFQEVLGPEFVVSSIALSQRNLWPANFPSAEAYVTGEHQFFDYVNNIVTIPKGLEQWYAAMSTSQFKDQQIDVH